MTDVKTNIKALAHLKRWDILLSQKWLKTPNHLNPPPAKSMNPLKIAGIGIAGLAAWTGTVQAYVFNWTEINNSVPPNSLCQFAEYDWGVHFDTHFRRNCYDWDRSVQVWQSFKAPTPRSGRWSLSAIGLQMSQAAPYGAIDLNVYEGYGVEGRLISSTKLVWTAPYDAHWDYFNDFLYDIPLGWALKKPKRGWVNFPLDVSVILEPGKPYTFSLENVSGDDAFRVVVDSWGHRFGWHENWSPSTHNPKIEDLYMQHGYMDGKPRQPGFSEGKDVHKGYRIASREGALNYRLLGIIQN